MLKITIIKADFPGKQWKTDVAPRPKNPWQTSWNRNPGGSSGGILKKHLKIGISLFSRFSRRQRKIHRF